jgi:hypothetical protein
MFSNMPSRMARVLALTAGVLAAGVVVGGPQAVALAPVAASTGHVGASAGAGPRPGCIGDSFKGTLEATKAICSEKYLVRMQDNGDLVLREISTGRACWASKTRAPGDAVARFIEPETKNLLTPMVKIVSASQGDLTVIGGDADPFSEPEDWNASVNNKGEFWVGFKKIANC